MLLGAPCHLLVLGNICHAVTTALTYLAYHDSVLLAVVVVAVAVAVVVVAAVVVVVADGEPDGLPVAVSALRAFLFLSQYRSLRNSQLSRTKYHGIDDAGFLLPTFGPCVLDRQAFFDLLG